MYENTQAVYGLIRCSLVQFVVYDSDSVIYHIIMYMTEFCCKKIGGVGEFFFPREVYLHIKRLACQIYLKLEF